MNNNFKITNLAGSVELNNGVRMPYFGYGTYLLKDDECIDGVLNALNCGLRHIDTASYYENEAEIGTALARTNIKREKIFVTTKVWNDQQGYNKTLRAFDNSLKALKCDYIDLYLIHWPREESIETWKALEHLYSQKLVRAIGVSNFETKDLLRLKESSTITPAVNQIEFTPFKQQNDTVEYCQQNNIALTAWAPLNRGVKTNHDTIKDIAAKHNKSCIQVILRWDLQRGFTTIPKSSSIKRIKENINIFDFSLDENEMDKINSLNGIDASRK